jgi:hypothetical protein
MEIVQRVLMGSIRHRSRSPFSGIAEVVPYGRAASRKPGHAFRLNLSSGPVCRACDIECCAIRWPVLHLRVAYFGQCPARVLACFNPLWPNLNFAVA